MKKLYSSIPVALAAGLLTATVDAHHSFSQFDRDNEMVKTGTVQRWAFNNPHSWLYLNIKNEDGSETLWSFEASAPVGLIGRGITGSTFEPGDTITFMFCPLRDGRPGGHMGWAKLEDGSYINPSDGGCNGNEANIETWKDWMAQGYMTKVEAESAQ